MTRWRAQLIGVDGGCGCERVRTMMELQPLPEADWPERLQLGGKRFILVPGRLVAQREPLTQEQRAAGEMPHIVWTQTYLEVDA